MTEKTETAIEGAIAGIRKWPYWLVIAVLAAGLVVLIAYRNRNRVVVTTPEAIAETAKEEAGKAFETLVTAATEVSKEADNVILLNKEVMPGSLPTEQPGIH